MEFLNEIGAWLTANRELLFRGVRVISVLSIVVGSLVAAMFVLIFPMRVRLGPLRIDPLLKFIGALGTLAWMILASAIVINSSFVVIAKFIILTVTVLVSLTAWMLLLTWPQINDALLSIQQECELATNLTFLQAEMARAQLEAVNGRIQQACQPQEREVTETVLRTVAPLVTMFLRRERSVFKWSAAALDVGKTMVGYFFSDAK